MLAPVVVAALVIQSLQPIRKIPMAAQTDTPFVSYTHDADFEYLGTPSTNGGDTFRYVIHHAISGAAKYPYIGQFVAMQELVVVGGFDKAKMRAYLAYSPDSGESWTDISSMVADSMIVSLLTKDYNGRLLVFTYGDGRLRISELLPAVVPKARSVRH